MINPEDFQPDPDDLTRGELAELAHLPWPDLAATLDEWKSRLHGVHSSAHGVGLFLDLLGEHGWEITRKPSPVRLPPPTE
jgi:hypothetical protein